MEIRILTPIPQILVANRSVDVGSPKARLVLAVLAESVGRPVPTSTLIDRVWGEAPPDSVRPSLHAYVSRIRKGLKNAGAPTDIKHRSRAYTLEVDPDAVDWHRAQNLSAQARKLTQRGEHASAFALLEEALELWDGDPFTEFSGVWVDTLRRRMVQGQRRLLGQRAEVGLVLGGPEETLLRLEDHPRDEVLAYLHMKALEMCGRHTEAIECYTELREHTVAELGAQPSPRTRALFQRILAAADGDEGQWAEPAPLVEPRRKVVDTLQPDVPDFLGRDEELESLLTSVRTSQGRTSVYLIHGLGGVGKTTLAAHAAHRLREEFDVRLQTDLTGLNSDQVLFRLLQMLGVPGRDIPAEPEARVGLWRSNIVDRKVLLFLDNASHHDQVAPVVPSAPGSAVLVTSRRSLIGLHGAWKSMLCRLDEEDAAQMFAAFTGRSVEEEGMRRIVSLAGHLPFGLRVIAAQSRLRFTWGLDRLADHFERQGRASEQGEDWELLGVFAGTFEGLDHWTRQTFLCLGLHPTKVISDHAAAASVGSWDETQNSLEDLLDVHFLEEVSPGRYRMHDLVRRFARQQGARTMSARQRWEVERRIFDFYLATVDKADRTARPGRRRTERRMPVSSVVPVFLSPREAREWFADNFPSIELVIERAREHGHPEYVSKIPLAMAGLIEGNGPRDRAPRLYEWSVDASRRLGDPSAVADGLYELGLLHMNLLDRPKDVEYLNEAIEVWRRHGGERNIPYASDWIARIRAVQGDHLTAFANYEVVLEEFRRLGDRSGVAKVFLHMAMSQSDTGRHSQAACSYLVAKQLYQELGDRQAESIVELNLFRLKFGEGHHREARAMGERCLRFFNEEGDVQSAAWAHQGLGVLENYLGRYRSGLEHLRAAWLGFGSTGKVANMVDCTMGVVIALVGLGRVDEAEKRLEKDWAHIRATNITVSESSLLCALGDVRAAQRRLPEAEELYWETLRTSVPMDGVVHEGMCWSRLGDLSSLAGDEDRALACWRQAARILERAPTPHLASTRFKIDAALYVRGETAG